MSACLCQSSSLPARRFVQPSLVSLLACLLRSDVCLHLCKSACLPACGRACAHVCVCVCPSVPASLLLGGGRSSSWREDALELLLELLVRALEEGDLLPMLLLIKLPALRLALLDCLALRLEILDLTLLRCKYLYSCTSKARELLRTCRSRSFFSPSSCTMRFSMSDLPCSACSALRIPNATLLSYLFFFSKRNEERPGTLLDAHALPCAGSK